MNRPPRAILPDTNVLLLWLVARTDPGLVDGFKRVQMFDYDDVKSLRMLIATFTTIVTTPHVLAETSNFLHQAPIHRRAALVRELASYTKTAVEQYRPAQALSQRAEFSALGLTDTAIIDLSDNVLVLTTDHNLAGRIVTLGGNAVHFNQLRQNRRVRF